jgi:two-component system, NarL family, nitrate/nitrite response regulator NarL
VDPDRAGRRDPVNVLVVEDQQLFAEALAASLREEGATVLDVSPSGGAALASVERECPELVLMDIGLPDASGLDVGREILSRHADVRIIALTSAHEPRLARAAFEAGFHGFLTKDASMHDVMSAIRSVLDGKVVVPHTIQAHAAGRGAGGSSLLSDQLTTRELEVLTLLTRGTTSPDIASALEISPNTVRTHVQSILAKLQVHSRLEAAAFAVRNGLVDVAGLRQRTDAG